jgi:hypothetical protein
MMNFLFPILLASLTMFFRPPMLDDFPTLPLDSSAPEFNLPGVDGRN